MSNQIPAGSSLIQADTQDVISSQIFAAKFKGKREIYNFLTLDVKAYLPAFNTITVVSF